MEKNSKNVKTEILHNLIMENRARLSVSGVEDVESFNEEEIVLHTSMGAMIICGAQLHINKLSVDNGEVSVNGDINSVDYPENYGKSKGAGLLSKLLREYGNTQISRTDCFFCVFFCRHMYMCRV